MDLTALGTDDPKLGHLLTACRSMDRTKFDSSVGIVGFAHDEGTLRNGGRGGGSRGPSAIRSHLTKIGPIVNAETGIDLSHTYIADLGDSFLTEDSLETAHCKHTAMIHDTLSKFDVCISIGGDNSQSFQNYQALMQSNEVCTGVVNIDAHLDVRPLKNGLRHSGSPFYCMLMDPLFSKHSSKFVEFAAQSQQCSKLHAQFVIDNGQKIIWYDSDIRQSESSAVSIFQDQVLDTFSECKQVFVSFDVDSIASRDCPGVSCPAPIGLSSDDALEICFMAGQNPLVRLLDISEFNPVIEEYRTGRLIANMIYYFLMGVALRPK